MNKLSLVIFILVIGFLLIFWFSRQKTEFPLPTANNSVEDTSPETESTLENKVENITETKTTSTRKISVTNNVKHSIPLDEILSGGPGKDGIPSLDNPTFKSIKEADKFLNDTDPGIGLTIDGESRFYPYRILVWHELVNDTVQGKPVLVSYCPLCATGIVFERTLDGRAVEFGVSGKLWRSNLLMYNRAGSESQESLWSQILGEAVVGTDTGTRLVIVPSDIVRWSDWKKAHPQTQALSEKTGVARNYSQDPYGNYYTSESVSFGASFNDTRLHPKAFVYGIEINGLYKAYSDTSLKVGETLDSFAGKKIVITRTSENSLRFLADDKTIASVPGFWFSWLSVHPNTELFQ